ncbi:nucleoside-diphosphate-sugar epimerase [Acidovorax sp. 56]|uniref:NAD-dependent epimerase/dehydratase family protein n=1 Tax=Acidovorax sp. 56 TaxID=2035205 RepID=UPI000C1724F3|nr:NAD-dependent epimerase/dehydratase family protein [Acidovorax sp. 56]PIF28618.1 nucleoside-diphosphate-sugar epimerase [Acidovorax sp. 56]
MQHVVITGAGGFVGAALVQRLRAHPQSLGQAGPLRLTLVDRAAASAPASHTVPSAPAQASLRWHLGSFADPSLLQALRDDPPGVVFHLASVPGALAEREPALGVQANLLDTVALLEGLAQPVRAGQAPAPRVVFASSVAVYGALGTHPMNEAQVPQPTLSYGTHKWTTELLLADYSRRAELDACSLRLPGVVARPPAETGHGSAFMSQIFHALHGRQAYTCPVSPQATAWWMSLERCLDNLLHAARMPMEAMTSARCWQPPVLHASVAQVVEAAAHALGCHAQDWIGYAPDPRIEAVFGRQPFLHTPHAQAAGFVHDDGVDALVARVLGPLGPPALPGA